MDHVQYFKLQPYCSFRRAFGTEMKENDVLRGYIKIHLICRKGSRSFCTLQYFISNEKSFYNYSDTSPCQGFTVVTVDLKVVS